MKLDSRWKIVLTATGFNLLFEISLRGGRFFFANPALILFIFPVYFTTFTLLEDLIGRFKLKDYHLMFLALIFWYGVQILTLAPDTYGYEPPLLSGINWPQFIWLSLVWYIALQTLMAFYIADRLFPRKEWQPLLDRKVFTAVLFIHLLYGFIFRIGSGAPLPNFMGILAMLTITVGLVLLAWKTWPNPQDAPPKYQKDRLMDILSLITVSLFLYFAFFAQLDPNQAGTNLVDKAAFNFTVTVIWTTISALVMFAYRIHSKKVIPV